MAADNSSNVAIAQDAVFGEVKRNWGWLLGLGIVFVILGFIGLGMTVVLTMASVLMFGILILIGGGIQLVEAFKCKGWKGIIWHLLMAILYVVAGVVVVVDPLLASMLFTLLLAFTFILVGIVRIVMAIQLRNFKNWFLPLLGGIISMILGVIILVGWPISGLWVIGLFVAIELIVNGWSYIFIALAARGAGKTMPQPSEATA